MIAASDELRIFNELGLVDPAHAAAPWYAAALERQQLSLTDCQTIRDLLEICAVDADDALPHLMLLGLFAVRNGGSLCLPLPQLAEVLAPFIPDHPVQTEATAITTALTERRWETLVGDAHQQTTPLILAGDNLYFRKFHTHETTLDQRIKALCSTDVASTTTASSLIELVNTCAQFDSFALNREQRWGVYLACRNRFTVISGGPGTGKTTLVAALLRALHQLTPLQAERVALIAPTGRAAHRLGESLHASLQHVPSQGEELTALTGLEGRTIHRLLRYNPSKHAFVHNAENPIEADVVICDEVSMIDVVLMDQLLAALPTQARVVFLGDRDQLPSVEAGAVLGELIPKSGSPSYLPETAAALRKLAPADAATDGPTVATSAGPLTDRIVVLQQSHRTRGAVGKLARAINHGERAPAEELPLLTALSEAYRWPRQGSEAQRVDAALPPAAIATHWVRQMLISDLDEAGLSYAARAQQPLTIDDGRYATDPAACAALFGMLAQGQILTVTRHGAGGCDTLNHTIAKQLCPEMDGRGQPGETLFAGMPVMVTRNDHLRDLYNGDVGIVRRLADNTLVVLFPRGGQQYEAIPSHQLPVHLPAFAITVHKSQGSEYGNVLLVLPNEADHRLLTREILYTGITRSKGNVAIHGAQAALSAAIDRTIQRYSGTSFWG